MCLFLKLNNQHCSSTVLPDCDAARNSPGVMPVMRLNEDVKLLLDLIPTFSAIASTVSLSYWREPSSRHASSIRRRATSIENDCPKFVLSACET